MLIMFKFVLQYCTDSTVSSVLLIFHKLLWQVLTASDLRASSAQMWGDKKWPLHSRNNYSRVCRKGAGKPSLEHAMGYGINNKTQRNRGTSEQCLTFLWLHLDRHDRKHRWKVSYLPMPAPQQVWQKVQVKGVLPPHACTLTGVTESQVNSVLPSRACTSTGVTESTGERCLTF